MTVIELFSLLLSAGASILLCGLIVLLDATTIHYVWQWTWGGNVPSIGALMGAVLIAGILTYQYQGKRSEKEIWDRLKWMGLEWGIALAIAFLIKIYAIH